MKKIAVLASGSGGNLQAIIDAAENGFLKDIKVDCVISNKQDAYALKRAQEHNIDAIFLDDENLSREEYTKNIINELEKRNIDLICLAGFMLILTPNIIEKFRGRIINIHPALLPKFCGKGMFGKRVHKAVIESGEKESGATVHFVDEGCDTGPIIVQEKVKILEDDTPETLAKRVLEVEHRIYPKAIKMFFENK